MAAWVQDKFHTSIITAFILGAMHPRTICPGRIGSLGATAIGHAPDFKTGKDVSLQIASPAKRAAF